MAKCVEVTDAVSGEKVLLDLDKRLSPENVVAQVTDFMTGKDLTPDFMIGLSFYMDYAIATKDMAIIEKVHDAIVGFYIVQTERFNKLKGR